MSNKQAAKIETPLCDQAAEQFKGLPYPAMLWEGLARQFERNLIAARVPYGGRAPNAHLVDADSQS